MRVNTNFIILDVNGIIAQAHGDAFLGAAGRLSLLSLLLLMHRDLFDPVS
jgi:hypothetical protein